MWETTARREKNKLNFDPWGRKRVYMQLVELLSVVQVLCPNLATLSCVLQYANWLGHAFHPTCQYIKYSCT